MSNTWNKLLDQQLVEGENPETDIEYIPWYIRFMQGFAGWLAALFILAFFAVTFSFIFKRPTGGITVSLGIFCSVGAYLVIKLQKNDFLNQIGMAFSLCGQLMFAIGLFLLRIENDVLFLILAAYQLLLAWIIPQYSHRLLTTSFGLLALLIGLNLLGFHGIGSALLAVLFAFIWLKESSWGKNRLVWDSIGLGVAITLVFSSGFLITGKFWLSQSIRDSKSWLFINAEIINSLLIAMVMVNLVLVLLKEYKVKLNSKTSILSLFAAASLVLISFKIYGISTGLILVVVGFARQRTSLIVLGAMSVVSFFSWYYYNLNETLLFKSITLMVLGLVLLIGWFGINFIYGNKTGSKVSQIKFKAINKNKWLAALTIFIAIIAINININKKQDLIENGEVLLFKLAPVDPRSLMQGDYMRLRFDMARKIQDKLRVKNGFNKTKAHRGFVVATKGENNIVSLVDLFHNQNLEPNQFMVPYKMRKYQVTFTTDAFYFQEGKASHFQKAEYGQFRRSESGEMLLVNMVDEDFNIL